MTATAVRPAPPANPQRRAPRRSTLPVRRTLLALLASVLGVVPLKALFRDWDWLIDAWITMVIVIAPAALLRLRRQAGALDVWPGIILLGPWLTWRFVSEHAWGGLIPSGRTLDDVSTLMTALHNTTRHEVAPIHTTVAVRLVVCALLGLLAALIDLIAVVGRRGALAGVPLLVVFTVAGAVPRSPVAWPLFAVAAAAFLVLLALDSGNDLESWGQRVHAPGVARGRTALAVSTQRIAAIAIAIAVLLPFLVPGKPRNLIAEAFHGGGSSGVGGFGDNGTSGGISPFAALRGQLERPVPIDLATVHVNSTRTVPFYLRVNVLSHYTDAGWSLADHGDTSDASASGFDTDPPSGTGSSDPFEADITIKGLTGNAPLFSQPTQFRGLREGTTWSSRDQLLLGTKVKRGDTYTEQFDQAAPSIAELRGTPPVSGLDEYTQGASSVPSFVKDLVAKLTRNASGPYDKARALSDYFSNPSNNFAYTLKTGTGDSGSALVDFLKSKEGFCQQYAAAMAIMLRVAGVPSRVVLGYMHDDPDAQGNFTVSTSDAHAWVEAYFANVGWIPFDTTPVTGLSGDAKSDLKWAPHDAYGSANAPSGSSSSAAPSVNKPLNSSTAAGASRTTTATRTTSTSSSAPLWIGVGVLVAIVLALIPAATRFVRRRRRFAAIRAGNADALWAELTDTAVDLGYVWSRSRTPRQVATWLGADVTDARALRSVTSAVEHSRYSPGARPDSSSGDTLVTDLRDVSGELRATRTGSVRVRSVLWPASLGWGGRIRLRRR